MPRARRPLLVTLALTSTLGFVACGGSDLSKADYIAKVDPICAKYSKQADSIKEPSSSDPAALSAYLNQVAALGGKQIDEIDKVGRPKEGKAQIEDLLKRQRNQVSQFHAAADALKGGDTTKANQIADSAQPDSDKIDSELKAYGFKECGGDS